MDTVRFFKERAKSKLKERQALGEDAGLQRVQHAVGQEAGFRSWGDLIAAEEAERELACLMVRKPDLNWAGLGPGDFAKTVAEREANMVKWRAELRENSAHVAEIREWLVRSADRRETVNSRAGSYRMKHFAEEELGAYVSNGELIAAAILAGYPYKDEGLNATFGISQRSIDALDEHRRARR